MGRLKEDTRYVNEVCLNQKSLGPNSLSLVIRMFFPVGIGRTSFTWECYLLLLGRKGEVSMPFLHLLFFKCPQLKITLCQSSIFWGDIFWFPSIIVKCLSGGFYFGHTEPYLADRLSISVRVQVSGPALGSYTLGSSRAGTPVVCVSVCVANSLMEEENGWILKFSTTMNCFKLHYQSHLYPWCYVLQIGA